MAESLGLVNSGVQDAAGQPLQERLEGLWMEELPTRTAAHGFTHPAGPTLDNCLHSPRACCLTAPTVLWEEQVPLSVGASGRKHVYTLYSPVGSTYHKNPEHTPQS